jgi:hypothetical protein
MSVLGELPLTKTAEAKLLEISFAVSRDAASVIHFLAQNTAKRNGHKTVTVYIIKAAYRHYRYQQKEEVAK